MLPSEVLKKKLAESENITKFWASSWGKKLKTQVAKHPGDELGMLCAKR